MDNLDKNEQDDFEDLDDDDIEESDYVFVLNSEGELKTLIFPEDLMEDPPREVQKILKLLGVKNIHLMEPRTLH